MTDSVIMVVVILFSILYTAFDAAEQTLDHHKGAVTLYDFWHLLRIFSRIFILLFGIAIGIIAITKKSWIFYLLSLIPLAVILKVLVWNPIYYKLYPWLIGKDTTVKLSTGIAWLDKFLGFDKNS